MQWARLKDQKLQFQPHVMRRESPPSANVVNEQQPHAPPMPLADPHLESLQRVTNQLNELSVNMFQGSRVPAQPPNEERAQNAQPLRRPARRQEYFCYNCGEDGHGMYFCPHPRRHPGNGQGRGPRRQVTPPRDRPQAPAHQPQPPVVQPQILRQPQAAAAIPPLSEVAEERAVNVIQLEAKGKEKMKELEVMPIKKARVSEEV